MLHGIQSAGVKELALAAFIAMLRPLPNAFGEFQVTLMNKGSTTAHADKTVRSSPVAYSKDDLCQFNERSLSGRVPDDYILTVAKVMQLANWHTYQVLTKRSERMRDLLQTKLIHVADQPHIWWGVSVENRKHGLPRIDHLRAYRRRFAFFPLSHCLST